MIQRWDTYEYETDGIPCDHGHWVKFEDAVVLIEQLQIARLLISAAADLLRGVPSDLKDHGPTSFYETRDRWLQKAGIVSEEEGIETT